MGVKSKVSQKVMQMILILALVWMILIGNGCLTQYKVSAAPVNYYVSTTGNDSNTGTITSPWKTIQKAANTVGAGGIINVRGGVYNEKVTAVNSGNATAGPIVFQSYPGETAIVDGTGLAMTTTYNALFLIQDKKYITIQNMEFRNYKTSTLNKMAIAIFVTGSGSNYRIRNNNIHNIESLVTAVNGGDAHGIAFYGTSSPASLNNIIIDGNTLTNLKLGSSEALVVNGNVDTFQITNNLLHNNNNIDICIIGWEGKSPDPAFDQARNGIVSGNKVYNTTSKGNPAYGSDTSADGIYVDGGKDTVIERNISHHNDVGIEFTSEHGGKSASNITVRNNLVYNNIMGISIGGYDTLRGFTENSKIVSNTLFNNDTLNMGFGQIYIQFDAKNNIIKDNIIYASSSNVLIGNERTQNSGNIIDYNLYYASAGTSNSQWQWKNVTYTGFAAYRSATGNDKHSIFIDPKFVSTTTPNLHLQATSPAINAGQNQTYVGAADYDGNKRIQGGAVDIGAFEVLVKKNGQH
jgi:hypothetical protein